MSYSLGKHLGKKWSSFIEIMAMMAILSVSIAAMFSTVTSWIYFSKDSENRIKAINLAREWIEWITNLRNTNWIRFSSDQVNCWRILNYDAYCIGSISHSTWSSIWTGVVVKSYVLENKNGAWYLTGTTSGTWLWIDSNWFYYASGTTPSDIRCSLSITKNCRSTFTREIRAIEANSWILNVTSLVDWNEHWAENVTLTTTLTNWRSKF